MKNAIMKKWLQPQLLAMSLREKTDRRTSRNMSLRLTKWRPRYGKSRQSRWGQFETRCLISNKIESTVEEPPMKPNSHDQVYAWSEANDRKWPLIGCDILESWR